MNTRFKKGLKEMLKDEHKAPRDYSKLIHYAPNRAIKAKIRTIQSQERNHYKILGKIKRTTKWKDIQNLKDL